MKRQTSKQTAGVRGPVAPPLTVLHIDDDPNDTELLRAAARRAQAAFILHNAEDTEQAIAYLSGKGIYADRQTYTMPHLVLLDLKMPRVNGFELLRWIRRHPQLHALPVAADDYLFPPSHYARVAASPLPDRWQPGRTTSAGF